jgi:hypothetical protein
MTRVPDQLIARPTPELEFVAIPPLMPQKAAWQELVVKPPGGDGDCFRITSKAAFSSFVAIAAHYKVASVCSIPYRLSLILPISF